MPKSIRTSLVLALAVTFSSIIANAQTDAEKAFNTLKAMPGTWEGRSAEGGNDMRVRVDFKATAGGSAVLSEILGNEDMVSMFHMDGPGRLLLTHYCTIGNQPRMEAAVSSDGKTLTFNYVDATNLSSPDAGRMQKMVLTLLDDNHHTEEWIFVDHGKEHKALFDLHRKI